MTSHATMAMTQPATTALQKMAAGSRCGFSADLLKVGKELPVECSGPRDK